MYLKICLNCGEIWDTDVTDGHYSECFVCKLNAQPYKNVETLGKVILKLRHPVN